MPGCVFDARMVAFEEAGEQNVCKFELSRIEMKRGRRVTQDLKSVLVMVALLFSAYKCIRVEDN